MRLLLMGVCFVVSANKDAVSIETNHTLVASPAAADSAPLTTAPVNAQIPIAEPPAVETETMTDAVIPATEGAEVYLTEPAEPLPQVVDWRRRLLQGTYFEAEFLYWEAKDPAERGQLLDFSTQTIPPGTIVPSGGFSTGQPNTDPEMGFRAVLGHRIGELLAVEVGGFWVNPFEYPLSNTNAITTSQSLGATVTTINRVDFAIPDPVEQLQFGRIFYSIGIWGVESNAKMLLFNRPKLQIIGLIGAFYVGYQEQFDSQLVPLNTTNNINENFDALNTIVGGQVGAEAEYSIFEYVGIRGFTKIGGGANFEDLKVTGPAGGTGRLTGFNNLGTHSQQEGQAVINFGASVVLRFTPNIDGHIGYSAIWMSDVIRAMDQIDFNPANVGNPTLNLITDSVLVGGFTGGVTVRF
jgi:hypothetical protein